MRFFFGYTEQQSHLFVMRIYITAYIYISTGIVLLPNISISHTHSHWAVKDTDGFRTRGTRVTFPLDHQHVAAEIKGFENVHDFPPCGSEGAVNMCPL